MPVPAIERQRRMRELGRIRLGDQVKSGDGKRPRRLTKFRLTSGSKEMLNYAAGAYGGEPTPWEGSPVPGAWELYTDVAALPVVVPPQAEAYTLWYELWSGGGCQRRCDGTTCQMTRDGSLVDVECACDPDPDRRECSLTLRVNVMLPDIPALGIWRLETHGYYAAVELPGTLDILQAASGSGRFLSGTLRLEERVVKRGGQTRRFVVPALDVVFAPEELEAAGKRVVEAGTASTGVTSSSRVPRPQLGPAPPLPDEAAPIAPREAVVEAPTPPAVPAASEVVIGMDTVTDLIQRGHAKAIGRSLLERICRYKTDGKRGLATLTQGDVRKIRMAIDAFASRPEAALERMETWERQKGAAAVDWREEVEEVVVAEDPPVVDAEQGELL